MMEKHIIHIVCCFFMRGARRSAMRRSPRGAEHYLPTDSHVPNPYGHEDDYHRRPTQIDLPCEQRSGLKEALKILDGVEGIGVVKSGQRTYVARHNL